MPLHEGADVPAYLGNSSSNEVRIDCTISVFHNKKGWFLLISGEMFGAYRDEDEAIDMIPTALRLTF